MQFSEKLNFLMDVTKTTNSALSRYISLDASYISRLRNGKRLLPRHKESIENMAAYFARNCRETYQKKALEDALGLSPLPVDRQLLIGAITEWLSGEKSGEPDSIEMFLGRLTSIRGGMPEVSERKSGAPFPRESLAVYYGVEGKRQSVRNFLSEIVSLDKPQTLLLFSDEETSWMTEDPAFTKQWLELMMQVISKRHRIKIIHTVNRDLDEMLRAISQWMTLYMAGTIEPYFYPRKRDGVFKKTLFIAPGTAALVSSSVGEHTSRAANLLFRDPEAVSAYEEEFLQYFRLCRPLMRILNGKDKDKCLALLTDFEEKSCDVIVKADSLSLLTMPEPLLSGILERTGIEGSDVRRFHSLHREKYLKTIDTQIFTDIISLPEHENVLNGKVKAPLFDASDSKEICYTAEEFKIHLKNVIGMLETYENYSVHIGAKPAGTGYQIYVKEDFGVIIVKTSAPPVILAMSEGNITAAFWDYLKDMVGARIYENPDKKETINRLRAYLEMLG